MTTHDNRVDFNEPGVPATGGQTFGEPGAPGTDAQTFSEPGAPGTGTQGFSEPGAPGLGAQEPVLETMPPADTTSGAQPLDANSAGAQPLGTDPAAAQPVAASSEPAVEPSAQQHVGATDAGELFNTDNLNGFRSRWDQVQAKFVDDPRDCVMGADGLVSEVVEELSANFADARSRLEAQWSRGEEVSTEELRLTLKRYREFFDRLLAV